MFFQHLWGPVVSRPWSPREMGVRVSRTVALVFI